MPLRGIRGATTATANTHEAIIEATAELLDELAKRNELQVEEIAAVHFTTTPDLTAEFPAAASRKLGWKSAAMICGHEMSVDESNSRAIPKCIRVLLLYNTDLAQSEMKFAYLRGAEELVRKLHG